MPTRTYHKELQRKRTKKTKNIQVIKRKTRNHSKHISDYHAFGEVLHILMLTLKTII